MPLEGGGIGDKGEVLIEGSEIARVGIFGSMSSRDFQKVGNNLYRHAGGRQPDEATDPKVRQYFTEGSGVHPAQAMVRLIASHRAYETNMQMIRQPDATMARAVTDIARFVA